MKRATSRCFYAVFNFLAGLSVEPGSSDFRLLDRQVVDVLCSLKETDIFYRGLIPTLGFSVATIRYAPRERLHGDSKYSLKHMVRLALRGLVGASTKPLRLATLFALLTALFAIIFGGYAIVTYLTVGRDVPGWTSVIVVLAVIGTMQLLVLGVIGEYLGQALREVRQRPPYVIAEARVADRRREPAS